MLSQQNSTKQLSPGLCTNSRSSSEENLFLREEKEHSVKSNSTSKIVTFGTIGGLIFLVITINTVYTTLKMRSLESQLEILKSHYLTRNPLVLESPHVFSSNEDENIPQFDLHNTDYEKSLKVSSTADSAQNELDFDLIFHEHVNSTESRHLSEFSYNENDTNDYSVILPPSFQVFHENEADSNVSAIHRRFRRSDDRDQTARENRRRDRRKLNRQSDEPQPANRENDERQPSSKKNRRIKGTQLFHLEVDSSVYRMEIDDPGQILNIWTPRAKDKDVDFGTYGENGVFNVERQGLYFIYSQMTYYDNSGRWCHAIKRNRDIIAKCLASEWGMSIDDGTGRYVPTVHNCFTSTAVYLRNGDTISIISLYGRRTVHQGKDMTYWGIIKLG